MGVTKTEIFTVEQNRIANLAKVIGHPARVAILQHLIKVNACINGDLVDIVGLSQPTISQHLRELKNVGLISGTIEGTKVSYCIDKKKYKEVRIIFEKLFGHDLKKSC